MKLNTPDTGATLWNTLRKLMGEPVQVLGDDYTSATKPAAQKPVKYKRKKKRKIDIEEAVDFLIAYKQQDSAWQMPENFRKDQIEALKTSNFDAEYWTEIESDGALVLTSTPSTGPFVGPRNYSYPDATNDPTITTYPDGVSGSGAPFYSGATAGGQFECTQWRWHLFTFTLASKITKGIAEPLFVVIECTSQVAATNRLSRPMLSLLIGREICDSASAKTTDPTPPLENVISAYWLYQLEDKGNAPFSHNSQKKLQYFVRSGDHEEGVGENDTLALVVAPMPMKGYRFNNNTSVSITLSDLVVKAYQVKKQVFATFDTGYVGGGTTYSQDKLTAYIPQSTTSINLYTTVDLSTGKWFAEMTSSFFPTSYSLYYIGIDGASGLTVYELATVPYTGFANCNGNLREYGKDHAAPNDVIGIQVDLDAGEISFQHNGAQQGVACNNISGPTKITIRIFRFGGFADQVAHEITLNCGQNPFVYGPPEGYNAGVWE